MARRAFIARFSSICPLCSTYIRAGQSEIAQLPEPISPRMRFDEEDRCYSYDTDASYHYDCRAISSSPREWAHRDCAALYYRRCDEDREEEPLWLDAPAARRHGGNNATAGMPA